MLFKLAFRNMRRSVKDYVIYFVTLIIAVVIFYAFNSITDQHIMHEIEATNNLKILDVMDLMMNMFSLVVALVLGFLVIYANQILVARRKMEFGIYFTLGMRPGQVSRILLYETVLVGLVSLVLGLVLGVLVSQLLSFATAALFGISMPEYQFDFSLHAFLMTLASFAAIYVVVAIFNVIMIRRCKLIDLINASKKSQKAVIRNPWLCLVLFIISVGILAFAYWNFATTGFMTVRDAQDFIVSTLAMLIGTFILFFSLAGFMVAVITRSKTVYFRKLRPFTLRQVSSKINTSFVSIWIVCVLLFLSITTFSTGMNLVTMFTSDINDANPYSISVLASGEKAAKAEEKNPDSAALSDIADLETVVAERLSNWGDSASRAQQMNVFTLQNITYGQLMESGGIMTDGDSMLESLSEMDVQVLPISQLNATLEMVGKSPIELPEGRYAVLNNMTAFDGLADSFIAEQVMLPTPIDSLAPYSTVERVQLNDFDILSTSMMLAVPDQVTEYLSSKGAQIFSSMLNIELNPGVEASEVASAIEGLDIPGVTNVLTRDDMIAQAMGLRVLLTYLAVYIGLVLLIATAAVLAIQLISLTIDSVGRYRMLVKIGCEPSMVRGSLFAQVLIFFCAPLAVALCHCICAIAVINNELEMIMNLGMSTSIICMIALVAIYGGYMLVTYFASKSSIKEIWVRA